MIGVVGEAEAFLGEIPAENSHTRIQVFREFREFKVELQRLPQALAGFLVRFRSHQQIERIAVLSPKPGDQITAQVAGRSGYENRHEVRKTAMRGREAPLVQSSSRGARDSSGRPSING